MYLAVDGSATQRVSLGEGLQHVAVVLGESGHHAGSTLVAEVLSIRLDAQVLHLRASVLHAQQEETGLFFVEGQYSYFLLAKRQDGVMSNEENVHLAKRRLHPVPGEGAHLQRSLQVLGLRHICTKKNT